MSQNFTQSTRPKTQEGSVKRITAATWTYPMATDMGEKRFVEANRFYDHVPDTRICGKKHVLPPQAENIHQLKLEKRMFENKIKFNNLMKTLQKQHDTPQQQQGKSCKVFTPIRLQRDDYSSRSRDKKRSQSRPMTLSHTGAQNSFDMSVPVMQGRRPRSKAELKLIIKRKAAQQKILEVKKGRVKTLQDPDEMTYISNSSFKQNPHLNLSKLDDIEVLDYKPERGRATGFRSIKDTPLPHPDLVQSKSHYYKGAHMSIFENDNHSKSQIHSRNRVTHILFQR